MAEKDDDDDDDVWMSDDGGDIIIVSREGDNLDDDEAIDFGLPSATSSHDPHAGYNDLLASQSRQMPIEIARVHRDHSQQGYLDGIVRGKNEGLQTGFDTGYPWGAQIGLDRGKVLGVCQGLVSLSSDQWSNLCQEVTTTLSLHDSVTTTTTTVDPKSLFEIGPDGLLEKCKSDLSVEALFSRQFWTPMGTPAYEDQYYHHPLIVPWITFIDSTLLPALRSTLKEQK